RVAEFVGELIGMPSTQEGARLRAPHVDAMFAGDQMLRAFEDWVDAECAHGPLVLVFDDLQWGDLPTIRFLDSALRRLAERPLMVLALARPEVHDTFPELWSRRGLVEIRLTELGRKSAEALCRQVLGPGAADAVVERLVARASGNALWLEELLRVQVEGHNVETSDTLVVLAQSRLEALDTDKRLALRAASVFGQRFWRGGVDALVGGQVAGMEALLRGLEEREIIASRAAGRFPGQREYEFRSALFRDAAYAALTDDDRELGHRLAANWLERAGESDALVLAEHFERGSLQERAVEWYLRGTRQALEGGDLQGAMAAAERGLAARASREQKGRLLLLQAEACKWQGKNTDCQRFALQAIECLTRGSVEWCAAVGEAAAASGKLGDLEACTPLSQKLLDAPLTDKNAASLTIAASRTATQLVLAGALELADRLLVRVDEVIASFPAGPSVMGWVFESRAVRAGTGRDPSARVQLAQAAAEQFELAGDLRNACMQRLSVGFACIETGANAEAEQALTAALALGERLNLSNSLPIAKAHLGRALARRGELEKARELELAAIEAFDEQGNQRLGGVARCYLCQQLVALGELDTAFRTAREAVLMLENVPSLRRSSFAVLALVQLARGKVEDAFGWTETAVSGLGPQDEVSIGESLVRVVHAEALYAAGKHELARAALRVARARVLERAAQIEDPVRRQAFLEGLPENVRTLRLASDWGI
ncbi:MAG TPA: serine/threonine-protein kinase PknK, partial [Polyangiaceae bacterium]